MAQVNAGHPASEPAKVGQIGSNRGGSRLHHVVLLTFGALVPANARTA
jgi:hypothetical protein